MVLIKWLLVLRLLVLHWLVPNRWSLSCLAMDWLVWNRLSVTCLRGVTLVGAITSLWITLQALVVWSSKVSLTPVLIQTCRPIALALLRWLRSSIVELHFMAGSAGIVPLGGHVRQVGASVIWRLLPNGFEPHWCLNRRLWLVGKQLIRLIWILQPWLAGKRLTLLALLAGKRVLPRLVRV